MCPRKRYLPQSDYHEVRGNIERTSVIAITVSDYTVLKKLPGTYQDAKLTKDIFTENHQISLYDSRYIALINPTGNQFRKALLEYSANRSAHGDILILYFSGHGTITGTNEFAFCPKDATFGINESKILPLSVITFRDVVQTLSAVDVFPVFIIDACFSGATAPQGTLSVSGQMQDLLHTYFSGSYALLASTSVDLVSFESTFGGFFTRALHSLVSKGLGDREGKHIPFLTMDAISLPLQEQLAKEGHPLSKYYTGPTLPAIAIAKNSQFSPDKEKFVPYFKRIIQHAWNNGIVNPINIDELLLRVGKGAYANHSKLSLRPWELLADGQDNSTRILTERGILFAKGELSIPETIIRDPITWDWIPSPDCREITINDIRENKIIAAQQVLAPDSAPRHR